MQSPQKKAVLFWSLVLSIFFVIFLLWLPSFLQSIQTITESVKQTSGEPKKALDKITPQIEDMKKIFDTFLKQIPVENTYEKK